MIPNKPIKPLIGVSGLISQREFLQVFALIPFIFQFLGMLGISLLGGGTVSTTDSELGLVNFVIMGYGCLFCILFAWLARKILLSDKRSYTIQKPSIITAALIISFLISIFLALSIFIMIYRDSQAIYDDLMGFFSNQVTGWLFGFFIAHYIISQAYPKDVILITSVINDSEINQEILNQFKEARKSLILISPFLKLKGHHLEELKNAISRGVNVALITREENETVRQIQGKGVHILYDPALHAKMVLMDKARVVIGSSNLYPTSMEKNHELAVVTNQSDHIEQAFKYYLKLEKEIASRVEPQYSQVSESDKMRGMLEGKYCYFCKEEKIKDINRPLCTRCWAKLKDRELCPLCGTRLTDEERVDSKTGFTEYRCQPCASQLFQSCRICNTVKEVPKKGIPLCKDCYRDIKNVWEMARYSRTAT